MTSTDHAIHTAITFAAVALALAIVDRVGIAPIALASVLIAIGTLWSIAWRAEADARGDAPTESASDGDDRRRIDTHA